MRGKPFEKEILRAPTVKGRTNEERDPKMSQNKLETNQETNIT